MLDAAAASLLEPPLLPSLVLTAHFRLVFVEVVSATALQS